MLDDILVQIKLGGDKDDAHLLRLQKMAIKAFADLNGWRPTEGRSGFYVISNHSDIYLGQNRGYTHAFFDHHLLFRDLSFPYRPAAVVGQPYDGAFNSTVKKDELKFSGKLGGPEGELDWHLPPIPTASIYYPGACMFCVVTRKGVVPRWLPEQLIAADPA